VQQIYDHQSREGWYEEYGGADPGYQTLCTFYLARLWQYTGDGVCDLPRASYPKSIANIKKAERNMFRGSPAAVEAFWKENAWQPAE